MESVHWLIPLFYLLIIISNVILTLIVLNGIQRIFVRKWREIINLKWKKITQVFLIISGVLFIYPIINLMFMFFTRGKAIFIENKKDTWKYFPVTFYTKKINPYKYLTFYLKGNKHFINKNSDDFYKILKYESFVILNYGISDYLDNTRLFIDKFTLDNQGKIVSGTKLIIKMDDNSYFIKQESEIFF